MRVGILGGSFNPPTIGHQLMAVEVLNLNLVDEVWMVPCGYREDKKYPVSDE
jgi:nicotinic acid mononucleotide adenylyltransferase